MRAERGDRVGLYRRGCAHADLCKDLVDDAAAAHRRVEQAKRELRSGRPCRLVCFGIGEQARRGEQDVSFLIEGKDVELFGGSVLVDVDQSSVDLEMVEPADDLARGEVAVEMDGNERMGRREMCR